MGGAVLLLYILFCKALRIPHGMDKLMLLSPAGTHVRVPVIPKTIVTTMYHSLRPVRCVPFHCWGCVAIDSSVSAHLTHAHVHRRFLLFCSNAPFPMRSSSLQRAGAKLLQDLKRSPATVDFMASVGESHACGCWYTAIVMIHTRHFALCTPATIFFGGSSARFPFQHVHFTDYPLGGSSVKVLRQGVQAMWAKNFSPYDYGSQENLRRYGASKPPLYRDWYELYDVPMHFMAGTRDVLIPPENIHAVRAMRCCVERSTSLLTVGSNTATSCGSARFETCPGERPNQQRCPRPFHRRRV